MPMSALYGWTFCILLSLKQLRDFQPKMTGQNGHITRGNNLSKPRIFLIYQGIKPIIDLYKSERFLLG
jgi:hypothetical protein